MLAIGVIVILAACDPGDVALVAPRVGGTSQPQLFRAVLDTRYASVATALGWTAGVPEAEVRLHLMAEPYDSGYWHVATTDSLGFASFAGLLSGLYEVEVSRELTASEMTRDSGVRLLAGGYRTYLPGSKTLDLTMIPAHRGSLVFSEFGLNIPAPWETGGSYEDAKYFEVYNNADSTVYLDGKYWGIGWDLNYDYPEWPCAQTEIVRDDPEGIWTRRVFRFPGRGTDYPLAPGATALIAKSAIDHRPVHPGLYDLRQADFEWGGSVDNPDVPDVQFVGLDVLPSYYPEPSTMPEFLSEPVDLQTLPRYIDPSSGTTWVRIPGGLVLDAWVSPLDWTTEGVQLGLVACLEDLSPSFERLGGPANAFPDFDLGLSMQRRVLFTLPDGRKVLQDTETSMEDFVKAARTPGWIP